LKSGVVGLDLGARGLWQERPRDCGMPPQISGWIRRGRASHVHTFAAGGRLSFSLGSFLNVMNQSNA
jgi:hypothetical protein